MFFRIVLISLCGLSVANAAVIARARYSGGPVCELLFTELTKSEREFLSRPTYLEAERTAKVPAVHRVRPMELTSFFQVQMADDLAAIIESTITNPSQLGELHHIRFTVSRKNAAFLAEHGTFVSILSGAGMSILSAPEDISMVISHANQIEDRSERLRYLVTHLDDENALVATRGTLRSLLFALEEFRVQSQVRGENLVRGIEFEHDF